MKLTPWHVYFATLLTVLGYESVQYPHSTMLQIALGAVGMLGTIAVPSLQEGNVMTENTGFPAPKFTQEGGDAPELADPVGARGASLMGVQRPVLTTHPVPEAPLMEDTAPAPEPAGTGGPVVTDESALVQYITQHAALLEEMAGGLRKLLDL